MDFNDNDGNGYSLNEAMADFKGIDFVQWISFACFFLNFEPNITKSKSVHKRNFPLYAAS